ncbi:MAG: hypothetical protein EAX90_15900 [Candidatus Heimdallarchaeota archaeon]|nr:hypothetical protein [Candidatus Heimdallarchaeota archaeon]
MNPKGKTEAFEQESIEKINLESEEEIKQKSLLDVIKLPWYELIIVFLLFGTTITMFILHSKFEENFGILIGVVISAAVLGLWLAFRPSEWAVDGLDNIMRYVGLTAYVAGVISSLASNLPEAVAAGIMLVKGSILQNDPSVESQLLGHELITTAFYTTLAAAGFNALLLGIVVLVGGKKKGYIEIKKETVAAEGVLLRWGFVATLLTFAIAVIEILDSIFLEVKEGTNFAGVEELTGELPRLAGITLVVSYLIYLIFLIVKNKQAKADEELAKQPKRAIKKPTRSKLDEKMPDQYEKNNEKKLSETAQRKVLDEPDEINIIDGECEVTRKTYTGEEEVPINPYLHGPHMERPHLSLRSSIILVILGIGGVAGGGYLLSHAVETMLESPKINIQIELVALIVGFSGAIPEHGIAVVAATKGKTDVALGNILGGILQMTLLIFGTFAAIVYAPINDFMLFQIIAIAGILWFVKRSIADDHRISSFEGIMIIIAQLFSFLLLIGELTGLNIF